MHCAYFEEEGSRCSSCSTQAHTILTFAASRGVHSVRSRGLAQMLAQSHGIKGLVWMILRGALCEVHTLSSFRVYKLPKVDHQRVANTNNDLQISFPFYLFGVLCKKSLEFCCSHQFSISSATSVGCCKMVSRRRVGEHQLSN